MTSKPDDLEPGDNDADPLVAQQKKTFRRWVNSHLAARRMAVKHIINDWEDGIYLASLVEILADTNLGKINTKPKMKLHSLENLNKSISFIQTYVKLVNIGSEDLYAHNQTIVLGLLWTLILRWGVKLGDGGKNALLEWVNKKVGTLGGPLVKNFDKDWQNGMKFAALVKVIDPEFNFDACSPSDPIKNMDSAFLEAEANLGIPVLLDPQDVASNPDEKSVMTYVGLFFNEFGNNDDFRVKRVKAIKPVVSNATATTADVTFQVPDGAKSVKVVVKKGSQVVENKVFPKNADNSSQTYRLTGLDPAAAFTVQTVGIKEKDDKETEPSEATEFSTSKVGAPKAPKVMNETETTVDVEIEHVDGAKSYEIQVASPASRKVFDRTVPIEAGKQSIKIDKLTPGTAHSFKVVGISASGAPTDPSAPTEAKTKLFAIPAPTIEEITDCDAVVRVHPSKAGEAPPAGTKYKVQVMDPSDGKGGWGSDALDLNQEGVVVGPNGYCIDELEPNQEYEVRLIAISPDGVESPPSDIVTFKTGPETPKSKIALVTGGNTTKGVELVKEICAIDSKFGKFDILFVCVREGGDALCSHDLLAMSEQPSDGVQCKIQLINYDKKNSESVKNASKMLKANKIHLIVNNAKLRKEQLSILLGNQ